MKLRICQRARLLLLVISGLMLTTTPALAGDKSIDPRASSRWGGNYFPNTQLVTHEGKTVRFFDDLVAGKVVMINFIYTSCPDACPLETARLTEVQRLLGDRVGKDVFIYSITIDPEVDTAEVMAAYAKKFDVGPGWLFLTGDEDDIIQLRRKLGLYIEEIQDGSNDHNLSLIIGNQSTGRWMKRSPFENPYVLARQVGDWLHNWKIADPNQDSYANAPELRTPSSGETLFRTRCSSCHTIGDGDIIDEGSTKIGPDLIGVVEKRPREWLTRWLAEPDKMLAEKDPLAMQLYARYNDVPMPNMQLTWVDVESIIEYLQTESNRVEKARLVARVTSDDPEDAPESCCMKKSMVAPGEGVVGSESESQIVAAQRSPRLTPASMAFAAGLGGLLVALGMFIRRRPQG
jgi:cytochrome oxidase Cu insertion factor (SCO1/SenC/PrrC family)